MFLSLLALLGIVRNIGNVTFCLTLNRIPVGRDPTHPRRKQIASPIVYRAARIDDAAAILACEVCEIPLAKSGRLDARFVLVTQAPSAIVRPPLNAIDVNRLSRR